MRFDDIRQWAHDRNLIHGSTPEKQMLKLAEEMGELAAALARGKGAEADDAVGDMVVVLTILSAQRGMRIETCIEQAWLEIKDRKGRMQYGVFVKEERGKPKKVKMWQWVMRRPDGSLFLTSSFYKEPEKHVDSEPLFPAKWTEIEVEE